MKHRRKRQMLKRLEERRLVGIPATAARGAYKIPGSQNPHKGRWGSSRRKLR